MSAQDFLTNINIAYTLLMIAVLLFVGIVLLTSKPKTSKRR